MKMFFVGVGIFLGLLLLGFVLKVIFFPVHTASKLIETGYDTVDKTLNADNAIYNYEWFKRQKESIDATGKKLVIAKTAVETFKTDAGDRSQWTFEDKTESARLGAVAQGIEGQLKDMISEYNARLKMANRNIFQDGIVPDYIDATTFIFKN
jgi:regulatory protein YycI of two-component signal transduction system YycFG